jgi:hypothetical protein
MTIEQILAGWENVRVREYAGLVAIAGSYQGVEHSGAWSDGLALAVELDRIAKGGAFVPPPMGEPVPSFKPSPEPEADPEPELEPEAVTDEAVTDEAPTADDEPIVQAVALSFEEISRGGIMLVEDELVIRRGLAWASVSDHADALVAAIIDPNRRTELIAQVAMAANKRQLGLQLDEADIEAESRFVALQAREDEIRRFERQMREAVRFASVDMLRDFDAEGAGWPT